MRRISRLLPVFASAALLLQAQTQAPAPLRFEVASVRPSNSGTGPGDVPRNMDPEPGHFAMHNVALRFAIEWAYDLKDYQLDCPDWVKGAGGERYEIVARASGPATDEQLQQMLQTLLRERFQLQFHRITKTLPVYALVLGKGAPKVKPAPPDEAAGLGGATAGVAFHNQPLSRLAFLLTRRMDRPTLDLTGLAGNYDYTLDISSLDPDAPAGAPSIYTAVADDLGLKLEARQAPVAMLIVDSALKVATGN